MSSPEELRVVEGQYVDAATVNSVVNERMRQTQQKTDEQDVSAEPQGAGGVKSINNSFQIFP